MKRAFPILAIAAGVLLGYATYQALVVAPTEQTMGPVTKTTVQNTTPTSAEAMANASAF